MGRLRVCPNTSRKAVTSVCPSWVCTTAICGHLERWFPRHRAVEFDCVTVAFMWETRDGSQHIVEQIISRGRCDRIIRNLHVSQPPIIFGWFQQAINLNPPLGDSFWYWIVFLTLEANRKLVQFRQIRKDSISRIQFSGQPRSLSSTKINL